MLDWNFISNKRKKENDLIKTVHYQPSTEFTSDCQGVKPRPDRDRAEKKKISADMQARSDHHEESVCTDRL